MEIKIKICTFVDIFVYEKYITAIKIRSVNDKYE